LLWCDLSQRKIKKGQQLSDDTHIGTSKIEHEDRKISLNQMEDGLKTPKEDHQ
jgi:hypothetical protein